MNATRKFAVRSSAELRGERRTESYGGKRRTSAVVPMYPPGPAPQSLVHSIHGSMMASLLRAPPRKAVRKYVLVELKRAGRRMDFDELVDLISCPGYDHDGKACAKHGKDRCGALEWVTDVDAGGNIVGKWERKLGVATRYEIYVAIGSLLDSGRIEIVEGQLRYQRHMRAYDALTPEERWHRADEEIRLMWQTMPVSETRSAWGRDDG